MLVGFADTLMVSSVGEAAVSGVSLVDQMTVLITATLTALASGGAVLCSQAIGRKDIKDANHHAKQLLLSNFIISFVLALGLFVFSRGVLGLLYGGVASDVMENANAYLRIIAFSISLFAINNALGAAFRAEGYTSISLRTSMMIAFVNLVGNAIGVYVFHAGVYGVALATLFSRLAGAIVMICTALRGGRKIRLDFLSDNKLNFKTIGNIFSIGVPMGLENFLFQMGRVMLTSLVATLGTAAVASYTVSCRIINFVYLPGTAIALAIPAIVGQCLGANEFGQAKKNAFRLLGFKYAMMLPIVAVTTIFAKQLAGCFNLSEAGIGYCVALIWVNNLAMLIRPFAFQTATVLRTATDVRYPMVISIASMWIFRVGFAFVFVKFFKMGVVGINCAMALDWIVRGIFYAYRFFTDKWISVYRAKREKEMQASA